MPPPLRSRLYSLGGIRALVQGFGFRVVGFCLGFHGYRVASRRISATLTKVMIQANVNLQVGSCVVAKLCGAG